MPPLRVILIGDHLAGHTRYDLVRWLVAHGRLPLFTALGGRWWNRAESMQRMGVRRALAGQHPETPDEIIAWLEAAVAGWNAQPTPLVWGNRRHERRQWARLRALGGSAALMAKGNPNAG